MTALISILLALTVSLAASPPAAEKSGAEIGTDAPDMPAPPERPAEMSYDHSGIWAATLNQRLTEAGFHTDDGNTFGRRTRHAVYAFQKHHGLTQVTSLMSSLGRKESIKRTSYVWRLPDMPSGKSDDTARHRDSS